METNVFSKKKKTNSPLLNSVGYHDLLGLYFQTLNKAAAMSLDVNVIYDNIEYLGKCF